MLCTRPALRYQSRSPQTNRRQHESLAVM